MTHKKLFSQSDMKAFAPSEKVGIIATVTRASKGRVVIDGQPVLDAVKRPRAGVTIEVLARAATRPAPPPPFGA